MDRGRFVQDLPLGEYQEQSISRCEPSGQHPQFYHPGVDFEGIDLQLRVFQLNRVDTNGGDLVLQNHLRNCNGFRCQKFALLSYYPAVLNSRSRLKTKRTLKSIRRLSTCVGNPGY